MYKVQFQEIYTWLKWSKLRHWKCQTLISALSLFITFYLSQQWHNLKKMFLRYSVYSCIVTETMSLRTRYFLMSTWFVINFKVDSTAVSILVVILVELTNTVFVNSTNITTNIERAALSIQKGQPRKYRMVFFTGSPQKIVLSIEVPPTTTKVPPHSLREAIA